MTIKKVVLTFVSKAQKDILEFRWFYSREMV